MFCNLGILRRFCWTNEKNSKKWCHRDNEVSGALWQESVNDHPWDKSGLCGLSLEIKFIETQDTPVWLHIVCGCVCVTAVAELRSWDRDLQNLDYLLSGLLQKKKKVCQSWFCEHCKDFHVFSEGNEELWGGFEFCCHIIR